MTDLLGVWRHYKGHVYEVLGVSKHSETLEETVIYRNVETGEVWNRPVAMWTETVDGKPRFERLSNDTTVGKLKARVAVLEEQLHEPGYVDALRSVVEEVGMQVPKSFRERPEILEDDFDMLEALPHLVGKYIEHLKDDTSVTLKELKAWRTANSGDEDRPLPEDPLIDAAHPLETDHSYDLYAKAVRMVGAKHSKYALVDLVNWLLVQNECLKALHGRPLILSQREMVRRSDLKACREAGEQSEAYVQRLAKNSSGVARVRLRGKDNPAHDITVFFPVREGLGFDPDRLQGSWPLVRGVWDIAATGEMSFDDEDRSIVVEWSDGDTTRTKLVRGLGLRLGRVLTFESTKFGRANSAGRRTDFIITEVEHL